MSRSSHRYVTTVRELRELVARLKDSERIALDTEFVGEDSFVPRLEIIQVAVGEVSAVIDFPAVGSLDSFAEVLGDGNAGAVKIGEKLQRFANNSGLGKNGTYEIKNKGITLKLDLKVTMDAGEVEKAIVLRKESILFDAIEELASTNLNEQNKERIRAVKGGG